METLKQYLTEGFDESARRFALLRSESREDEAVFERIRGNVFDIFRSVAQAAQTQADPRGFFLEKLASIPAAWSASREQALTHGDEEKAHIEAVKLEAAAEIRAHMEVKA